MSQQTSYNTQQKITINEFGEVEMLEPSRNEGFTFYDTFNHFDREKLVQERISNIINIKGYYYVQIVKNKKYLHNNLQQLTNNISNAKKFTKRTEAISAEIEFLQSNYLT